MSLHDAGRAYIDRALEDAENTEADAADSNSYRRGRLHWDTADEDPNSAEGWIDLGTVTDDGITFGFDGANVDLGPVTLRNGDTLTVTHRAFEAGDPITVTLHAGQPPEVDTAQFVGDVLGRYAGESPGWWLPPRIALTLNTDTPVSQQVTYGEASQRADQAYAQERLDRLERWRLGGPPPFPGQPAPATPVRGQTPGQAATGGVVDDIDAATEGRCACGCGLAVGDDSPSAYYATDHCQRRYLSARATNAQDVYDRADAALVPVGADHVPVPLDGRPAVPDFASAFDGLRRYAAGFREMLEHGHIRFPPPAGPIADTQPDVFTCPDCGRRSTHPEDIRQGYCRACHDWTGNRPAGTPPRTFATGGLLGNHLHFDARTAGRWLDTTEGTVEVIRYRRFCPHCNARRAPEMYREDQHAVAHFGRPDRRDIGGAERQRCSSCRHTWPGPPYLASFDAETDPGRYELWLRRGRWKTRAYVDRAFLADQGDPRACVDEAWERLERELWENQRAGRRRR